MECGTGGPGDPDICIDLYILFIHAPNTGISAHSSSGHLRGKMPAPQHGTSSAANATVAEHGTKKAKKIKASEPQAPPGSDLRAIGCAVLCPLSQTPLIFKASAPTRSGKGFLLAFDLEPQPSLENGYSSWHGTRLTNLKEIFSEGLLPGPSEPKGIYTYKDSLKEKCFGRSYCPAVRCRPGVFMKVRLHVLASGLRADHPPKTMRKDQWISEKAVVLGLEAEIFFVEALEPQEVVLDFDWFPNIPTSAFEYDSMPAGVEQHASSSFSPAAATEHGTSSANAAATEKTDQIEDLITFLTYAFVDFVCAGSPATEQPGTQRDCQIMVMANMLECSASREAEGMYTEEAMAKHSKLFVLMTTDKEGREKENLFLTWCRKCAQIRAECGTDAERARATQEDDQRNMFKVLGAQMLQDDTFPDQKKQRKYRIQYTDTGEIRLTQAQRSWINMMLRKHLGHANVAHYILQEGLPRLFAGSAHRKIPGEKVLRSILDEGMRWHACLLQSLLRHEQREDLNKLHELSMLEKPAWVQERKDAFLKAKDAMKQGEILVMERDTKKRTFGEMSATEQQTLADYDTGKLAKRLCASSMQRDKAFRGVFRPVSSNSASNQSRSTLGYAKHAR